MSIASFANQHVLGLVAYEPGKPIEETARELGLRPEEIVKLASNENPLGPSPKAKLAMAKAIEQGHIYPDGAGFELRQAIAKLAGFSLENIVIGNGSSEIIELLGHAFLNPTKNIVVSRHAFVIYKLMAKLFGAETIEIADPGFRHDLAAMAAAITPETRLVFVTNPNNPTGTLVSQKEINEFMAQVPDHVVVVFDEAYFEFVENPPDTLKFIREGKNVCVLRTCSKIQGLAALRIGYAYTTPELAGILQKTREPFNVNAIAQSGALASLEDSEHAQKTKVINFQGLIEYEKSFAELGLKFVPSHANFIMVNVGDGARVFQEMLQKGVIVRALGGYELPEWIRITVGTAAENERCLAVLREVLATHAK